jgi:hypothetical protein
MPKPGFVKIGQNDSEAELGAHTHNIWRYHMPTFLPKKWWEWGGCRLGDACAVPPQLLTF